MLTQNIIIEIERKTGKPVIVSTTGVANGSGSDRFKSVTRLSKLEREAIRNDTHVVLITGCRPAINGKSGVTYRRAVKDYEHRFTHRLV